VQLPVGHYWLKPSSHPSPSCCQQVVLPHLLQDLSSKPAAAKYFAPGQSVWCSNWLLLKGNVWYVAATILTYACNYTVFPAFITYVVPSPALGTW
jgi:hypothetical protein